MLSNAEGVTTSGALGSMARAGTAYDQAKDQRRQELILGLNERNLKRENATAASAQRQLAADASLDRERRKYIQDFRADFTTAGLRAKVAEIAGVEIKDVTQELIDLHRATVETAYLAGLGLGREAPSNAGANMADPSAYSIVSE